ncbi:hypothetical protein JKF63_03728 [Porcisia hertigi]|uniref:Uncharacterized protein n=1 Tax=Porcisia hertigi TaxID=2761500 RepID=A0A836L8C1_9TRYP|nr:hypothetical protein JKF63_03728 [Porcisia hertigi]
MATKVLSLLTQNLANNPTAFPDIGTVSHDEGDALIVIFLSLAIVLLTIGTCVFVRLCRSRGNAPCRYTGTARRCTAPSPRAGDDFIGCNEGDLSGRSQGPSQPSTHDI